MGNIMPEHAWNPKPGDPADWFESLSLLHFPLFVVGTFLGHSVFGGNFWETSLVTR
jgi:hypothetical protein